MRDTAEIAHHHTEAVVQWHRDAELILMGKVLQTGHKVAIVQDVMMTQSCPFREARGTACVLNVDRIIELLLTLSLAELLITDRFAHCHHFLPGEHPRRPLRTEANDRPEIGQFGSLKFSWLATA